MAKKKKKQTESEEPRVVGRLGASGEIAPFESARVLGRVDEQGNRVAYIQAQKEDIAPVKKKDTWFKNGMDDSGYAYTGTLDKINRFNASVLMTGVDILGNIGLGITKPVEGVGDFVQNRTADVLDFFGGDKAAEKIRKSAKKEWGVNKELEQALASDNGMGIDDMSFLGQKGKSIPQGLGSVLLASATGGAGGAVFGTTAGASATSLGLMGVGAAGNAEQEALEQGATRKEARMYGLISGVGETLSEMMFGGLSQSSQVLGIGSGVFDSFDDAVASQLTKKINNKIVKNLLQAGVKATGEGVEEVVSGLFDAVGKKLTYMKKEDIKKLIEDENLLDSFLSGAFSAAISQAPGYVQSITTTDNGKVRLKNQSEIRDYITNLNAQEQQVVEQEIQDRINEEGKITKKRRIEIEKQVIEDLDRGYISADKIEKTLGENYNQERDTRLAESFNERARKTQAYENDISKYDEKQAKVIQKAIDSGLLNNSNKTHDFVDLIAKISADKGVDFDFTNNERINESGFGIKGKIVNGYVKDGTINLNLESNQALNKTVGHEITHVLEGTDVYKELQNSLKSYLGEREWNNRIDELAETYKNVENANIENELTSDLVGEYVFNDEKFVKSLSTRNPNLFQKIFDEIKYMVKIATAGSKEARDLEKVKRAFEKAYRETSKTQQGTQYQLDEVQKTSDLNEYVADAAVRDAQKLEKDRQTIKDAIQEHLEEEGITNPTREDMLNAFDTYDLMDASDEFNDYRKAEKLVSDVVDEMLKENKKGKEEISLSYAKQRFNRNMGKYSIGDNLEDAYLEHQLRKDELDSLYEYAKKKAYNDSELRELERRYNELIDRDNPNQADVKYSLSEDNNGRTLSQGQQEFVKGNAKELYDKDGKIKTYYHTTTNEVEPFDVFNPVGTPGYKYDDIVVNFYTDNPVMSGSYADSDYVKYSPEATEKARYQYEGYISMKNPYVIDSDNRSYGKANIKANESASKTLNILNNLKDETIKELASIKQEAIDKARNQERLVKELEYLRNGFDNEQKVAIQIGEILDATEKYNLNAEAQERNNRLINSILEREGYTNEWDLDNLKYEYYTNDLGVDLSNYGIDKDKVTLKDFLELENKVQAENKYAYEFFDDMLKDHTNNKQIQEILDTTFDLKKETRVLNEETGTKQYGKVSDLVYDALDMDGNLNRKYLTKEGLQEHYVVDGFINQNTNDVIREVLEMNKNGANYDGVIFKNLYDYGGSTFNLDSNAGDVVVTFNSNQFKDFRNENPTSGDNINYSLSQDNIAPTSGWNVRSEDVRLQSAFKEAIAPLQEQVQELTKTIQNIVPSRALTEEEANEYATQTQEAFENEAAPIRNNLTPEENQRMDMLEFLERNNMMNEERRYEKEQLEAKQYPNYALDEEVSPSEALSDIRDPKAVGKVGVKAYQFEHPEVKPYFQEEARQLLHELDNSSKGERFVVERNDSMYGDWKGVPRNTSPDLADLFDGYYGSKYTQDDIRKGLNAIIEDHGAENIAVAKRIEFVLDDRLRNGYEAWDGVRLENENGEPIRIPPNSDYLNMLAEQEWQNYFDDINNQYPLDANQVQYALEQEKQQEEQYKIEKSLEEMTAEDINLEPFLSGLQGASERQAERQQLREELNQKREVKIPKQSDGRKAWNRFKSLVSNEFAVLDDYSKQTGNKDIKFKTDTYNNYQAIAQSNIETAQTDINGKAIGRSGSSIFEEAKKLGLENTFDEYLKQWANVDRAKQGKGVANYSVKESYKIVKEMEAKYPVLKRLGKDMWQYYRNARHNLRDAGVINQDVSDMLGRMYPHYTPYISENIENYFTDEGKLKPKATIKRAKGGAAIGSLLSAEEAMQRYTKSEFNTIFGNDLFKEIVNTSNDIVQLGGDDRGMQFVNADNLYADKDGYYLTAYENGEPITARINEDMYRTLTRESRNRISDIENTFSAVTKPLQAASKLRRNILTSWSPTFFVKNALKDIQEGVFNSKYTKDFIKNYPSAFKELASNTELAQQFKSLYGSGLTMGQYDIDSTNYTPSGKNKTFLQNIKNLIPSVNEIVELAPRYAEFKASIDHGASLQEAMYNAREVTTNFSRGGTLAKALNRNGFTFLNSSIQGFDKFIRNFSGENGAKGIVNSLAKAAIFGIAPAVFNELAFGSGDDKDEEYEALPDYIKDNYYIIKTGDGNFIRIPKGRVLSVFGSAARRTIEAMEGEENAFEGYWNNVQQQIGINNPEENNIFAPLIQAMGGRKLDSGQTAGEAWYGGDIIPSRLQKERPEDQYDASIDKFSIWLGQKTGISPYKINYVLDQYTGGIGDIGLPIITPEANSDGSIIAPIKDQFTADTITDNKYVSEFYDTKGKLYTGSKATDEDVLKNKYMNSISSEMAKLYAERRDIQADDSLTKQQKYAKSQAIKAEINRLAKEGLDNYENIITSNNYAKIGDTEYYKNANGQWTKVTDDVASLGLDTEEKNEYYKVKNDIYTTKKENDGNDKPLVMQDIINSNLTPDAKVNLYTSNYKDELIQPLVDSGMDVDSYLTFKSQSFTADKDSNGKSISGSKKQKVFDYVNSMDIPYEQKLILAKSEYNSFNDNNYEIIEYIENSGMDYDERIELYKALGFKVDGDSISW